MPRVSIIMATRNNAPYLRQSLDSVLHQTSGDWELIVVDDASIDNSAEILEEYAARDRRIRIIKNTENLGLTRSCNIALKECQGEYIMRLDGDDFLDEHAVAILVETLDSRPDVDLVDCDHFLVNEAGEVTEYVRRMRLYEEREVLDLPPISTAVLIRKGCYDSLNGYNEELACQDTYDFWMRFIQNFKAYNINLPLWYYRQHPGTLTKNRQRILKARRHAKSSLVNRGGLFEKGKTSTRVLGIIPMRSGSDFPFKLAMKQLAGHPLIFYVIKTALAARNIDRVIFTTEDVEIASAAVECGVEVIMRPSALAKRGVPIDKTVNFVLKELEKQDYVPDIVALINVNSPLMTAENIEEAINTLLIFKSDSVISVIEDNKLHYTHDKYGLTPLFGRRKVRLEREELYEENGAIYISRRQSIQPDSFIGKTVSHVVMLPEESVHIDTMFDLQVAQGLLEEKERTTTN